VLTDALGLTREYIQSTRGLLPGTRFAVEAYLTFVRERRCSKVSPPAHRTVRAGHPLRAHRRHARDYNFVEDSMMGYFRKRLTQAPRDVTFALRYVREERAHAGHPAGR